MLIRTYKNIVLILVLAYIMAGSVARFFNLEQKVYWYDEVSTSITVSGKTELEILQSLKTNQLITYGDLLNTLDISKNSTIKDSIKRLAVENPHHPPLYYVVARIWSEAFGTSVFTMRLLPALLSLCAIYFMFALGRELFNSTLAGMTSAAVMASSPIFLVYAQEARQYSLLYTLIIASSWVFLCALKHNSKRYWLMYALTITLGMYTQLVFVSTILGQSVFFFLRYKESKPMIKPWLSSAGLSAILFLPWLVVIYLNHDAATRLLMWVNKGFISFDYFIVILNRFVTDRYEFMSVDDYNAYIKTSVILLIFPMLFAYLLYKKDKKTAQYTIVMIVLPLVLFCIPDLLTRSGQKTQSRYLLQFYIFQCVLWGFALSKAISTEKIKRSARTFFAIVSILIIFLQTTSISLYMEKDARWNKHLNADNGEIYNIVINYSNPVLISYLGTPYLLSLAHTLKDKTQYVVIPKCANCIFTFADSNLSLPNDVFNNFLYIEAYNPKPNRIPSGFKTSQNSKIYSGGIFHVSLLEKDKH